MYISKLHIHGFKSFFHKTNLNFGQGITSVIGPNGCGKSNIVDAIRWVLGEQKTTSLRSTKMEDVIFNGSKHQRPLGFCEVSLTIFNNKKRLPSEYTELEITRRLYRSGESEYLLNKVPCRLKDINGLFIDSGMGAHAYSVIELKMIDSILSQNPQERRQLFEEAAGINQYRLQRHSAVRKLDAVQIDLNRIRDIISEVETSVKNLKLQLKRFERHRKLSDKIAAAEILLTQARIQRMNIDLEPLRRQHREKKTRFASMDGQMNLDETLVVQVRTNYESVHGKLEIAQKQLRQLEGQLQELNNTLLVGTEQKKAAESRLEQYADERIQVKARKDTVAGQIAELKKQLSELNPQIDIFKTVFENEQTSFQEFVGAMDTRQQELQRQRQKNDSLSKSMHQNEARLQSLRQNLEEREQYQENYTHRREQFQNQLGQLRMDISALQQNLKKAERTLAQHTLEQEKTVSEQAKLEQKIIDERSRKADLQNQQGQLESKSQMLKEVIERHEGHIPGTQHILKTRSDHPGVLGVLADLITVPAEYSQAVELALGELVQYLVVETREQARNLIGYITEDGKDYQLNLIALDALPDHMDEPESPSAPYDVLASYIKAENAQLEKLLYHLLQGILLLPHHKKVADIPEAIRKKYALVSADGGFIQQKYLLRSGKRSIMSLIGRRNQLDSVNADLERIKSEFNHSATALKGVLQQADEIHYKVQKQGKNIEEVVSQRNELEKELTRLQATEPHILGSVRELDDQQLESKKRTDQMTDEEGRLQKELADQRNRSQDSRKKMNALQEEINQLQGERHHRQQKVQDARIKLVEVQKEYEGYQFRYNTAADQLKDMETRLVHIAEESDQLTGNITQLSHQIDAAGKSQNDLVEKQNELQEKCTRLETDHDRLYEELQDIQECIRNQQRVKEETILELQGLDHKINGVEHEIASLRQRILDRYNQEVPQQVLNLEEIDIDQLSNSIETFMRSKERIGPINMAVEDEHKREEHRLEFLTKQLLDLEESESNIAETIQRIDEEARSKFLKTFEEVAEHFHQTYSLFFDGGEAHIRLVGDEDPLESELQIIARPPGKKTQTLRMLSAGEKALTAIALLFAIYLVKPSPFCILDEVDAPLDDINVRKFTRVLHQFTKDTQFIVVTHNKLTMEEADYMYGVTQEEEGISQVVSVQFKDGIEDYQENSHSGDAVA